METLDTVVTVEIWEVGDEDSLVYRQSGPLNGRLSEDQEISQFAWDLAFFHWRNPRTCLGGEENFVGDALAELPWSWRTEYRVKVVVAHPKVNDALHGTEVFVRLSSTSK